MTKTTFPAMMTKTPAPLARVEVEDETRMTDRTATELLDLCKRKDVEFDTALTEFQARERIAALKGEDA